MSGHTPGPWTFSKWEENGRVSFYVAQSRGAPFTPDFSDVATITAETVANERVEIQEANARLIAAAPLMLEALQDLTKLAIGPAGGVTMEMKREAVAKALYAIAAARGAK